MSRSRWRRCGQCERRGEDHTHEGDGWELRYASFGLDEVIARGATIHLETMSEGHVWIGITLPDGTRLHVNILSKNERAHLGLVCRVERERSDREAAAEEVECG